MQQRYCCWSAPQRSAQQRNINFDLLQAARTGSVATTRALLDQGANPNSRNRLGDSPLNTAARNGNVELVQLLLDKGADVNLANLARVTPLMSAVYGGQTEDRADPARRQSQCRAE